MVWAMTGGNEIGSHANWQWKLREATAFCRNGDVTHPLLESGWAPVHAAD